jgi:DNA polymerase III delta prime subunit
MSLAKDTNESHILLRGFPGSGKKIMTMLYLQEKFGTDEVFNIKKFYMECKIPGKSEVINLQVMYTPYYYYLILYPHMAYDKAILDYFITNIISYKIITTKICHRIIIIDKADLLSIEAQQSLRRTLETKINSCRFIFIAGFSGHIIDAIYSRCNIIKILSPTDKQVFMILRQLQLQTQTQMQTQRQRQSQEINPTKNILTNKGYNKIICHASGNIKKALHMLQIYEETGLFAIKNDVVDNINGIVAEIIKNKNTAGTLKKGKKDNSVQCANAIRGYITALLKEWQVDYGIISHIFKELISYDLYHDNIFKLASLTSKYDYKMKQGNKVYYYIECYCLEVLQL